MKRLLSLTQNEKQRRKRSWRLKINTRRSPQRLEVREVSIKLCHRLGKAALSGQSHRSPHCPQGNLEGLSGDKNQRCRGSMCCGLRAVTCGSQCQRELETLKQNTPVPCLTETCKKGLCLNIRWKLYLLQ